MPCRLTLTKAQHEPLISLETFKHIQARLAGAPKIGPERSDTDESFPLRGFVECAECGYKMTACWSRSRSGALYPYYLCHHKGCGQRGKSTRKEILEADFASLLKSVVPAKKTMVVAEKTLRLAWDQKRASVSAERAGLEHELRNLQRQLDKFIEMILSAKSPEVAEAYEDKVESLQFKKAEISEQIAKLGIPVRSFDEMFEHSMRFLANPCSVWEKCGAKAQRMLLRLVFQEPLRFSRETGLRTAETTYPFNALADANEGEDDMAHPTNAAGAFHVVAISKI